MSAATEGEENPFLAAMASEAKEAGLKYYLDDRPGVRREKRGEEFVYIKPNGNAVTDEAELLRIKRLAIPPAWTEVWICPSANGHLQATGRDARKRKQYRYHARWREQRDENKFLKMLEFARALPGIRKRVDSDLARSGMPRQKVLATVVRLLEITLIRVGNEEYAKDNKSFGLTTMRDRHAKVEGQKISFSFRGKSGKKHHIDLHDRTLARIVRRCQELPGQELFAYEEEGEIRDVTSQDVNDYLHEIAGSEFTAKDFRTWAGTVLAALALKEFEKATSKTQAKKNVTAAVEAVSKMLGNTPAVCRKCYVHPEILETYFEQGMIEVAEQLAEEQIEHSLSELKPEEAAVVVLLSKRLKEKGKLPSE